MTLARSNRITLRATMVAVAAAALAACSGTTEVATKKDVVPFTISTTTTDTLRAAVGAAVAPVTVTVVNKAGEPLDTTLVTFVVATGGGTISSPTVRTNASGRATTTWTLGSAVGLQTMTATAGTLAPITFRAVAAAGSVSALTKVAGDLQTASVNTNVPVAPSVKVVDKFGNPLAGQLVSFTIGSGGGTVTAGTVTSGADGVATVGAWRLGATAGANTLVASSGTFTATFTATAAFGAAAVVKLTPVAPNQLLVGQTVQLTAQVSDASANVITGAVVTYASSNTAVASVSAAGLVTATGAGSATITGTSGTATASVPITVIGHPAGSTISNTLQLGGFPGDVAFTKNAMLVAVTGTQQILFYDATGTTLSGTLNLTTPVQILLAPTKTTGPAVAISIGTTSRLWFIDPATASKVDSLDINDIAQSADMTSDGSRIAVTMTSGTLAIVDGATHQVTRVGLGGGVTSTRIAPGDSLLYAMTNVGVVFEVDIRNAIVKRQIITNATNTDFAIGQDGLFYMLDGPGSLVRIANVNSLATPLRTVGVSSGGAKLAVTPDVKQIWVAHQSNPGQVTFYTGSIDTGFLANGQFLTANGLFPIKIFMSPNGSFAAITNFGGWVDIVR